jgi:hypothetical protein
MILVRRRGHEWLHRSEPRCLVVGILDGIVFSMGPIWDYRGLLVKW